MHVNQAEQFKTDSPPLMHFEGHLAGDDYDLVLPDMNWQHSGEGSFETQASVLILNLTPVHLLKCRYKIPNISMDFQHAGDLMFVLPGNTLDCRWKAGKQRTISCSFDADKIIRLAGYQWDWREVDPYATIDVQNQYIAMGLRRLAEEVRNPGFATSLQIECTLTFITLELIRHFSESEKTNEKDNQQLSTSQIEKIKEVLLESEKTPTLRELAEACDIPSRNLSKMFINTTGYTLRKYLAEERLQKAQRLLLNDQDLLIKQVAIMSGFESPTAFTATFRRATGFTPQEFRSKSLAR